MRLAAAAAPNPLSMFTTVTPAAHELSMPSRAAIPPNEAPYPTLVGTAITGTGTSPPTTLGSAPSMPATTITTAALREERSARRLESLRDRDCLLRRLPLTQDHLLVPLSHGPEVIDGREGEALDETPQVLERHAACAAKIASASCMDSIRNSRSLS